MDEDEWLHTWDVRKMYGYIESRTNERKLRLFACAACRRYWHLLPGERPRHAVEAAERYADDPEAVEELLRSRSYVRENVESLDETQARRRPEPEWGYNKQPTLRGAADSTAGQSLESLSWAMEWMLVYSRDYLELAALLRDVIGNPWRPPAIDPVWLARDDGAISRMAELIYNERAFDRLPYLGDALEEAGCSDPVILDHCRKVGEHARGCWLLDALLGRS